MRLLRDLQFLARVVAMLTGIGWVLFGPGLVTMELVPFSALTLSLSILLIGRRSWLAGPLRPETVPVPAVMLDLLTATLWTLSNTRVPTSTAFFVIVLASIAVIGRLGTPGALISLFAALVGRGGAELIRRAAGRPTEIPFLVSEGLTLAFGIIALGVTFAALRTERARTGDALERAERELNLRQEYVSLVAHELRNPLIGIRIAAEALGRKQLHGEATASATGIATEAAAGLKLLDDLAEVSMVESGRIRSALRPVDLAALVRATVASFAADRQIEIRGSDGPLDVLADSQRIAQVIRNLLSNALKYSPTDAPIEVDVGRSFDGAWVIAGVRDFGPGVPPAERSQLFDKFRRLSTAGHTRGSGLGLYISREIVREHGGELTADWPSGGGSVFSFSLRSAAPPSGSRLAEHPPR